MSLYNRSYFYKVERGSKEHEILCLSEKRYISYRRELKSSLDEVGATGFRYANPMSLAGRFLVRFKEKPDLNKWEYSKEPYQTLSESEKEACEWFSPNEETNIEAYEIFDVLSGESWLLAHLDLSKKLNIDVQDLSEKLDIDVQDSSPLELRLTKDKENFYIISNLPLGSQQIESLQEVKGSEFHKALEECIDTKSD